MTFIIFTATTSLSAPPLWKTRDGSQVLRNSLTQVRAISIPSVIDPKHTLPANSCPKDRSDSLVLTEKKTRVFDTSSMVHSRSPP
jgi:hypothetical protein